MKKNLKILTEKFFIFHQVGKNFEEEYTQFHSPNYHSVAFVGEEMIELMKFADITLSRAGAGTVCELMAIGKKSIFVPLKIAQKNEQFHNAKEAEKRLGSIIMTEDELELNPEIFLEKILSIQLPNHRQQAHQENGKNILLKNILLRLQS